MLQCPLHRVYVADALPEGTNEPVSAISALVAALSDGGGGNTTQRRALRDAHGQAGIFGEEATPTDARNVSAAPYEGFPWRTEVDFLGKDHATQTIIDDTVTVHESGVYSMWFVACDPALADVRAPAASRCSTSPLHSRRGRALRAPRGRACCGVAGVRHRA